MASHEVSFNFNNLFVGLDATTMLSIEKAAIGLDMAGRIAAAPSLLNVPEGIGIQFNARPLTDVRQDFEAWVLTNTFRDCIEAVAHFLEEGRRLAAALTLSGRDEIPALEFDDALHGKVARKFHRAGLPDKSEAMRSTYGLTWSPDIEDRVNSINAARNCLVHRRGIVGEDDCKNGQPMALRWLRPVLHARAPDGTVSELRPTTAVVGGTEVFFITVPEERAFAIGERFTITANEFASVWWTIRTFGLAVTEALVAFAKTKGITFAEPAVAPPV